MTEAEYRADPRMNVSLLVHGLKSMRQLKHVIDNPQEQTPAMKLGTMAHVYLLQPDVFDKRYVVMPNYEFDASNCTDKGKPSTSKLTNYYKSRVSEFEAENFGSDIVSRADIDWCEGIAESVRADPKAAELLGYCEKEVPLFGSIEGVECKGLIDLLNPLVLGDLKTTVDVSPHKFASSAAKLHYPFRLSFYRELARQNKCPIQSLYLIAVESKAPFDCVVNEVPGVELDNAFDNVCRVLRDYKRCLKDGVWPGVSGGEVQILSTPNWAMEDDESMVEWSEAS